MTTPIYLPIDELTGRGPINHDLMADWLELNAFFAEDRGILTDELANQIDILVAEDETAEEDGFILEADASSDADLSRLDEEMRFGKKELVTGAISRIVDREKALGVSYPFELDSRGEQLDYVSSEEFGQASYILCLLLSNLRPVSSILASSRLHPTEDEIRNLRRLFQYFGTAALAAEIHGCAWSFGSPRPDGSGFLPKLVEIWTTLRDGHVKPQRGASRAPKDDLIDVFAARPHRDGLPGFLLAVGQVATGKDFKTKSLKGHVGTFKGRWFSTPPITQWIYYMIIPFTRSHDDFIDDILAMGNVLHRLRVPRRVAEAGELVHEGVMVEGYELLQDATRWLVDYRQRAQAAG